MVMAKETVGKQLIQGSNPLILKMNAVQRCQMILRDTIVVSRMEQPAHGVPNVFFVETQTGTQTPARGV